MCAIFGGTCFGNLDVCAVCTTDCSLYPYCVFTSVLCCVLSTGVFIKNWWPRFFAIRSDGTFTGYKQGPIGGVYPEPPTTSRLKVGECRHVWVGVGDKSTGRQVVNTGTICTIA